MSGQRRLRDEMLERAAATDLTTGDVIQTLTEALVTVIVHGAPSADEAERTIAAVSKCMLDGARERWRLERRRMDA
jgi:hypothetical protein